MTEIAVVDDRAQTPGDYRPSWVNVVAAWVDRRPGPAWLAYMGLMAAGIALQLLAAAVEPAIQQAGAIQATYYGALPVAVLGLIHLLYRSSTRALQVLRPVLTLTDADVVDVTYQLVVVPTRPALAITAVSIVITPLGYVMDPVGSGAASLSPVGLVLRWGSESLVTALFLILIFHTFRQLRLIDRLHASIGDVDLFNPGPLCAMPRVTSTTAAGLVVLLAPACC